jgi:HEAT repeats
MRKAIHGASGIGDPPELIRVNPWQKFHMKQPPKKSAATASRRRPKPGRLLGITLAATALLGILAAAWHSRRPEILAERWQARLTELPDAELEPQLRRIAELGDAGIPVLTAALGSPREPLRDAAQVAILDEMARWELLPAEAATARLSTLAESLAAMSRQFDRPTHRFAADLALRILHWPHEDGDARRPALLAHCEAVLAAAAAPRRVPSVIAIEPATASPIVASTNVDSVESLPALARYPGGGLPVELASLPPPREIAASRHDESGAPTSGEPNRLPEQVATKPIGESAEPYAQLDQAPAANQPRRLPTADDSSQSTRLLSAHVADRLPAEINPSNAVAWNGLKVRELMQRLDSADAQIAANARGELKRRGIAGPLVELARRAADPNPTVRLELAESLPTFSGVDARPWLLELSYDDDPRVRTAAVTLMATSGDIDLLKRVQQVSLDDPDDHTRAQAEKALPKQKRGN